MSAVTRSASASPCMALNAIIEPNLFPLKSVADVVHLFQRVLTSGQEPDLTLLSIVVGYIELSLTTGEAAQAAATAAASAEHNNSISFPAPLIAQTNAASTSSDVIVGNAVPFPIVTHELVAGLYKKFQTILSVVEKPKPHRQATREVIKKVSDVIWNSLIRSSYKDRAHLQNLYSYLSGNKLDCFGVALAVVAGCQLLGYRDVHLAISEDHAWVVFGQKRVETIEVTWHGKGSEDKRGQDITPGIESGSWLYLAGLAVVCDRNMEVAAICSAINNSLTINSDCVEVAEMQQQLLWVLYDMGHLKKYPMALGALGELEEISPSHANITCEQLYREAIESARTHYRNHHVYPYTFQGNYYNRLLKYREAFAAWANAADVIRLYTYNCRDDEEVYKELLDIANEMIPYVMKTESSGHSARSILRDSEVFANLLRFYDGICQWEEDSLTPILHIGWAKPLVNNITKFDYDIRSQVVIKMPEEVMAEETERIAMLQQQKEAMSNEAKRMSAQQHETMQVEGNNNNLIKKEEKSLNVELPTTLADLTAACGEKILNPDFLLQGGGQPFAEQKQQKDSSHKINNNNNNNNEANGIEQPKKNTAATVTTSNTTSASEIINAKTANETTTTNSMVKDSSAALVATEQPNPLHPEKSKITNNSADNSSVSNSTATISSAKISPISQAVPALTKPKMIIEDDPFEFMLKRPVITLYSQKMKGLKDLLLAEKLNTHAISLQVTAQSVASRKVRGVDKSGNHTTISTYATVNVTAIGSAGAAGTANSHNVDAANSSSSASGSGAAAAAAATTSATAADSIAVSRPKRTRRE